MSATTSTSTAQRHTDEAETEHWRQRETPSPDRNGGDRMGDGGAPWWVRFATFFGVPALIAVYLVWHVTHLTPTSEMIQHTIDVRSTNELLQVHIKLSTALELRQEQQDQRLERVLRAICLNGASTQGDRLKCVD